MLLFGMPGGTEWIILTIIVLLIVFIVRGIGKRSQRQQQGQQQQTNLNIHNYSITSELEKLNELKEKGVLTQEEFEVQKRKLLNS